MEVPMDPLTASALATSAINILIPFLSKAGENISLGLGEGIGGKISELMLRKFSEDKNKKNIIDNFQNEPENIDFQKKIQQIIEKSILEDQAFRNELMQLLKTPTIRNGDQISVNVTVSGKGKVGDISGKIIKKEK